ncbi:PPC domain-containing protein [bacterium]|nr:PPC domain-containing protein [bacterium]
MTSDLLLIRTRLRPHVAFSSMTTRWAVLALLLAVSLAHAAPQLDAMHPIGFQRGKKVTLNLVGNGLGGDIEIISSIPGSSQLKPVDMVEGKPAYSIDQRRDVEIDIAADTPVGLYPIRVRTADGISNQLLFSVGSLPDIGEAEPNNLIEQAQVVPLGTSIIGSVNPADRDLYKLSLPAGTRLVAEIEAGRLGLPMDSALSVLDSRGKELASSDDAPGLGSDSRVDVTLAHAGDYFVSVNDVNFSRGSAYRLKIGSFDYADGIFPLGGPKSPENKIWSWTRSESSSQPMQFSTEQADRYAVVQPMGDSSPTLPFRFVVSSGPEVIEAPGSTIDLKVGETINGRLDKPGEKDVFKVHFSPNEERVRFRLTALSLGSPLLGVLSLKDVAGATVATSQNPKDPEIAFNKPATPAAADYTVEVSDIGGRGGLGFAYRLSAEGESTGFSLRADLPVVNIPANSFEYVPIKVDRRGYAGPIQVFVPESVQGIIAEGGSIGQDQTDGYILLSAAPNTSPRRIKLELWGRGGSPARPIDRKVRGIGDRTPSVVDPRYLDPMPAALCQAKPLGITVAGQDVRVAHGSNANVNVTIQRGAGVTEEVRIVPRVRTPSYPDGLEVTIPKDKSDGVITFPGNVERGLSRGIVVFEAITNVAGREVRVTLPPITVEVVRPFAVEVPEQQASIPPTGEHPLAVIVRREGTFKDEVRVRVDDLPKGIVAEPLTIAEGVVSGNIQIKAAEAVPGEYTIKLVAATDVSGRKQTKDYELPPQPIRLTVTSPPKEEKKQ